MELEPYHDPIHDQQFYLDKNLRQRLADEYGVYCNKFHKIKIGMFM